MYGRAGGYIYFGVRRMNINANGVPFLRVTVKDGLAEVYSYNQTNITELVRCVI